MNQLLGGHGPLGGIQIIVNKNWPQEKIGMETVRFEAHPIIKWLARWLPIKPYVEAEYPVYGDTQMMMDKTNHTLFCSPRQHGILVREFQEQQRKFEQEI